VGAENRKIFLQLRKGSAGEIDVMKKSRGGQGRYRLLSKLKKKKKSEQGGKVTGGS